MRSKIWFVVLMVVGALALQAAGVAAVYGVWTIAIAAAAFAALTFYLAACALLPEGELLTPIALEAGRTYVVEHDCALAVDEQHAIEQHLTLQGQRLGVRFVLLPHFLHLALQTRTKGPKA